MTILAAGTFRVSDYRKAIPVLVKIICAIRAHDAEDRAIWPPEREALREAQAQWVRSLRFDHRPPLEDRPYDTVRGDFIPPQNDPDFIEAINDRAHDERTFGRKADAEKIVTTRGSDVGEAARTRKIRDSETIHQAKLLRRVDPAAARRLLGTVRQKTRLRPKRKIANRGFDKRHRPMRGRS